MKYIDFKEAILRYADEAGLAEYDLYYTAGASTTVRAYENEIDTFSANTTVGVCFRCLVDGKIGYSNSQQLSDGEARRLVADAAACADILESTGFAAIYKGGGMYADVPRYDGGDCDVEHLKSLAIDIEKKAKAVDSRIVAVPYAYAAFYKGETALVNSYGVDLQSTRGGYTLYCQAVAEDGGRKYSGGAAQEALTGKDIDLDAVVSEATGLALGSIGGRTVASAKYPVVFSRRMMCELLSTFSGVFSGDAAQKGLSLLSGKENEAIAADIVNLVDDPHMAESAVKTSFDDEGVPTAFTTVIESGVLKTLFYDLQSAAKAKVKSTGNGRKGSYAGDVSVAPWNFCLRPGKQSFDRMISGIERGVYITELKGTHAGASASTGDFSLEAKGMFIENGKASRPVELFTVAGNFYQMLMDIEGIADDFLIEDGVGSPSVLVRELSIAGEG